MQCMTWVARLLADWPNMFESSELTAFRMVPSPWLTVLPGRWTVTTPLEIFVELPPNVGPEMAWSPTGSKFSLLWEQRAYWLLRFT